MKRDDRAYEVWRGIRHATAAGRRMLSDLFREHELTGSQFRVLRLLDESGEEGVMLSQVGDRLRVTCGNITNLVDRLEQRGYVRRRPHPTDRRVLLAELTSDGREALARITPMYREKIARMMACLADDEQEMICELLNRIAERARELEGD